MSNIPLFFGELHPGLNIIQHQICDKLGRGSQFFEITDGLFAFFEFKSKTSFRVKGFINLVPVFFKQCNSICVITDSAASLRSIAEPTRMKPSSVSVWFKKYKHVLVSSTYFNPILLASCVLQHQFLQWIRGFVAKPPSIYWIK